MAQMIRVVQTRVYEYTPDLNEDYYQEHGISAVDAALKLDEEDYKEGKVTLDELCLNLPQVSATWSIVDEPGL
jgi:hypothetical protein